MLESRDKLLEAVFEALEKDVVNDGMASALLKLRVNNPEKYLEIVAMFLFEGYSVTKVKDISSSVENVMKYFEKTLLEIASQIK